MHTSATPVRLSFSRTANKHPKSKRAAEIVQQFGLLPESNTTILDNIQIDIAPGKIIAFHGPSGSGKSTALNLIADKFPTSHNVDRISFPADQPIVDAIRPQAPLADALQILSLCGLGEPRLWLRPYHRLSEGEQFRARLAKAVAATTDPPTATATGNTTTTAAPSNTTTTAPIIVDELAAALHDRATRAVAFNLRKLATRRKIALVVATNYLDSLIDLQPDTTVHLLHHGHHEISHHKPQTKPLSLWRRMKIEPGTKADYNQFAAMHYRTTTELGFVDKIFVLRDQPTGLLLGIIVYAHAPAESALRNQATNGLFRGNLEKLNQNLRIIRRVVVHPDLRGCGVTHRLIRRTLPLVGTKYVECLATMGQINPVFQKAGMTAIGQCPISKQRQQTLDCLKQMDVDPLAQDFETQVHRRPAVRSLIAKAVYDWYRATSGQGRHRVANQPPAVLARLFRSLINSRPTYYLWKRPRHLTAQPPTAPSKNKHRPRKRVHRRTRPTPADTDKRKPRNRRKTTSSPLDNNAKPEPSTLLVDHANRFC